MLDVKRLERLAQDTLARNLDIVTMALDDIDRASAKDAVLPGGSYADYADLLVPLLSVIRRNRDRPYNSALRQDVDAVEKRARDIIDSNPALARQMPAAVQRYAAEKKQLRAKKTRSKLRVVKGGA